MLNKRYIFKSAHIRARSIVSNTSGTKYARSYREAFSEALKNEYRKLRLAAEREAIRLEQNIGLPVHVTPAARNFFVARRSISAIGA